MIEVKVTPSSTTPSISFDGKIYQIRIKEPADKGKANAAVTKALKKHLKKNVVLVRGKLSRHKYFEVKNE